MFVGLRRRAAIVVTLALAFTAIGSTFPGATAAAAASSGTRCVGGQANQRDYTASPRIQGIDARTDIYACQDATDATKYYYIITIWGKDAGKPHISVNVWVCGHPKGTFTSDSRELDTQEWVYESSYPACNPQINNPSTSVSTNSGPITSQRRGTGNNLTFYLHMN